MAKENTKTITTPFGVLLYPFRNKEDVIKQKPSGKIAAQLVLAGAALETMKQEVEDFIAEVFPAKKAKAVNRPFKQKDGEGPIYIRADTFAYEKDSRKPKPVPLTDVKGQPVKRAVELGSDSKVRFRVTMEPTEFGGKDFVKFWLNAIQIKTRKEPQAGSGFGAADDDGEGWTEDEFDGDGDGDSAGHTAQDGDPGPSDDADF